MVGRQQGLGPEPRTAEEEVAEEEEEEVEEEVEGGGGGQPLPLKSASEVEREKKGCLRGPICGQSSISQCF